MVGDMFHTYSNAKPLCFISCTVYIDINPMEYKVTEGVDDVVVLMLNRSGDIGRETVVMVTTFDGSAMGETACNLKK